jgi:hypothetical protein
MRGVSQIVLILLILVIAMSSISVLWLSFYSIFGKVASSGNTSTLGNALSSCMNIDSVKGNKVYLRNCGDGAVTNSSLRVYFDNAPVNFSMSPLSLGKGETGIITLYGLWGLSIGNYKLKITMPSAEVERYVKTKLPDSCVLDLEFDEGQGNITHDSSGYGNDGIVYEEVPSTQYSPATDGSIRDWLIIGYFPESTCACQSGDCSSFISETSTYKYSGLTENGKTWFEYHDVDADNKIDLLNEVFPPGATQVVAYAFAVVYSPTTRYVQLRLGSDDGIEAWLNSNLADNNVYACRGASPDQDIIPVTLNQGYNYLLLRVGNGVGDWGFYSRFTDLSGNPQTDLNISLDSRFVKWVDGKFGKALQFDGINDYVNVSHIPQIDNNAPFTISFWMYQNSSDPGEISIVKEVGRWGGTDPSNLFAVGTSGNSVDWLPNRMMFEIWDASGVQHNYFGNTILQNNIWYNLAYVFDNSNNKIRFYLNGILDNQIDYNLGTPIASQPLTIGQGFGSSMGNFNGLIDELRIYNKSLNLNDTVVLTLGELG